MIDLVKLKTSWYTTCATALILLFMVTMIFVATLAILDNSFSVHELDDLDQIATEISPVRAILATLDATAGVPNAVEPPTQIAVPESRENSYNLILAGNDYRDGRMPDCPTCILVHTDAFIYVNIQTSPELRVTMVSIPRELFLHVDGIEPDSRVDQLYSRGGLDWMELWAETILGVPIDGVMVIDMDAFVEIVDRLGGISVRVFQGFRDKCGDEWYEYQGNSIYELDGFEALCFARMRMYNPQGYFARQSRHNEVLIGIFKEFIESFTEDPLVTSVMTVSTYLEYVQTNISPEQIAQIVGDVSIAAIAWQSQNTEGYSFPWYTNSISRDMLELYPRSNENSPYLYQPTFLIRDWIDCLIGGNGGCEIEQN